jgi:hypothetical protein
VSQEEPVRHKSRRRESTAGRIWRQYRFEFIGLIAIALGLFLILERLNLRASLAVWFREFINQLFSRFQQLDGTLGAFLARLSLSDLVGALLITCAVVAVIYRVRWRLLNNPALSATICPKCGGPIHRIHRKPLDRLISLYVPVRRYRCHNSGCAWRGLRVGRHHVSAHRARPAG